MVNRKLFIPQRTIWQLEGDCNNTTTHSDTGALDGSERLYLGGGAGADWMGETEHGGMAIS